MVKSEALLKQLRVTIASIDQALRDTDDLFMMADATVDPVVEGETLHRNTIEGITYDIKLRLGMDLERLEERAYKLGYTFHEIHN